MKSLTLPVCYAFGQFQVSPYFKKETLSFRLLRYFFGLAFCLSQTQMLLFLNYRNINANTIAESKSLSERFQQRHRALEDYITEV